MDGNYYHVDTHQSFNDLELKKNYQEHLHQTPNDDWAG